MNVVLVPGFWLGGWAWDDVVGPLRSARLVPHAVTLPGMTSDVTDRASVTREDQLDAVRALVGTLDGDVVTDFDGVGVVVDRMSAPYLNGATIDFVDTIEKQGFTIDNPNAGGSCACGDSFH